MTGGGVDQKVCDTWDSTGWKTARKRFDASIKLPMVICGSGKLINPHIVLAVWHSRAVLRSNTWHARQAKATRFGKLRRTDCPGKGWMQGLCTSVARAEAKKQISPPTAMNVYVNRNQPGLRRECTRLPFARCLLQKHTPSLKIKTSAFKHNCLLLDVVRPQMDLGVQTGPESAPAKPDAGWPAMRWAFEQLLQKLLSVDAKSHEEQNWLARRVWARVWAGRWAGVGVSWQGARGPVTKISLPGGSRPLQFFASFPNCRPLLEAAIRLATIGPREPRAGTDYITC